MPEQNRPDDDRTNRGYDEAARGGKNMPKSDVGVPLESSSNPAEAGPRDEFDRAAREAANDVRRRETSAD